LFINAFYCIVSLVSPLSLAFKTPDRGNFLFHDGGSAR